MTNNQAITKEKNKKSLFAFAFLISLSLLLAFFFFKAKAATSVDVKKDVDTVVLKDGDGDGLLDSDDPHPDVPEIYIVEDENRDGIVDAYQAEMVKTEQND